MPKGKTIQRNADVKNRQFDSGKRPAMQPIMIARPVALNVSKPERRNVVPGQPINPRDTLIEEIRYAWSRPTREYTTPQTNIPSTPMIARQGQVRNTGNAIRNLFNSITRSFAGRTASRRNNR